MLSCRAMFLEMAHLLSRSRHTTANAIKRWNLRMAWVDIQRLLFRFARRAFRFDLF